jgi:hypothetical protein
MLVLTIFVTRSDTIHFHVLKCHYNIVQICVLLILDYKTLVHTFAVLKLQAKKYAKNRYLETDIRTLCAVILVRAEIRVFTVFLQNNIAVFRSCVLYRLVLELWTKHEENSFVSPILHTTRVQLLIQVLSHSAKNVRTESQACAFRRLWLLSPRVLPRLVSKLSGIILRV